MSCFNADLTTTRPEDENPNFNNNKIMDSLCPTETNEMQKLKHTKYCN